MCGEAALGFGGGVAQKGGRVEGLRSSGLASP